MAEVPAEIEAMQTARKAIEHTALVEQNLDALGREFAELRDGEFEDLKKAVDTTNQNVAKLMERGSKGQNNWFTVRDAKAAMVWINDLRGWHDRVYERRTGKPLPECWLWHPLAVEALLALQAHYVAAWKSSSPAAVSDVVRVYWPALESQVAEATRRCAQSHRNGSERRLCVDWGQAGEYVAWWVDGSKPTVTGLPPGVYEAVAAVR